MPKHKIPNLIGVIVYGTDKQVVESAAVVLTNSSGSLTETSNVKGEVLFNLSDLPSYTVGKTVTIKASKSSKGTIMGIVTVTEKPQKVNLYLTEVSDLDYVETDNRHVLNFSLLTSFDGEKITNSNPLPVTHGEIDLVNNPSTIWSITRDDGQPDYEEVTIRGVKYRRTFTYDGVGFMTARSQWVKQ